LQWYCTRCGRPIHPWRFFCPSILPCHAPPCFCCFHNILRPTSLYLPAPHLLAFRLRNSHWFPSSLVPRPVASFLATSQPTRLLAGHLSACRVLLYTPSSILLSRLQNYYTAPDSLVLRCLRGRCTSTLPPQRFKSTTCPPTLLHFYGDTKLALRLPYHSPVSPPPELYFVHTIQLGTKSISTAQISRFSYIRRYTAHASTESQTLDSKEETRL
jgi:hypothetical protein